MCKLQPLAGAARITTRSRPQHPIPMRYLLLATDYDGTLASHGVVSDQTVRMLQRVQASGRKRVLVTGRHMLDLKNIFPQLDLFHRIVAENGALLYRPSAHYEKLLCKPPLQEFLDLLLGRTRPFYTSRC